METISTTSSSISQKYEPIIIMPGSSSKNRIPGNYQDIPSKLKNKNNINLLHACKLLKSYYNEEEGINALVLDGKEMRTTRTLERLGKKLKSINIVEYNNQTYELMLNLKRPKVHCFNCHLKEYIDNLNDPNINVAYFDTMSTFLSTERTFGGDIIINEFLRQNVCDEIILGATFCLRNPTSQSYETEQSKILLLLDKIFIINGFRYKSLIPRKNLRYKGQKAENKSMVFVLFYLKRE